MRSWLFVLSLAVLGCGETSTTPPIASTPAPIEAVAEPLCAVELHDGSAWVKRADLACPTDALNLLVVGDVGHANPVLDSSVAGAKAVCAERRCDLMLVAGDLIYGPGADAEPHWAKIWDAGLATLNLPAVAVLGNHEWRHEPEPEKKRAAIFASDGRLGLIAPSSSFAVRITRDGKPIAAVAALDTDSVSNPAPEMPGLGAAAFDLACGEGVPVIAVGHHPPTSQGLHHGHEAEVEAALRTTFATRRQAGCDVRLVVAGHDHDLQVYPKSCEQADVPAIVVAGVTGRGFRKAGEQHLPKCGPGPSEGRDTVYVADRGTDGGFAHVEFTLGAAESSARLYATPASGGPPSLLHTTSF